VIKEILEVWSNAAGVETNPIWTKERSIPIRGEHPANTRWRALGWLITT
jgi:hypothetical protein